MSQQRTPTPTTTPPGPQAPQTAPLRVAAYVRYSSRAQRDGYSIAAQQAEITREGTAWAARTGQVWDITWHIEPERSARAEKIGARTVFRDLLATATAGGAIDLVVVHKLDRFARSLRHQLQFIHELAQSGVGFYSVVEKPDFSSPQGRMVANMFGVLAQFYSDNLGEEIKKGVYQRAEAGYPWGPPPFGYRTKTAADVVAERAADRLADAAADAAMADDDADADADALPPVEPDVPMGAAIPDGATWGGYQRIVRLALAGHSDSQVAAALNHDGRWRLAPERAGKYAGDHGAGLPGVTPVGRDARLWTFWAVRRIRTNEFYRPFSAGDSRGTIHVRGARYRGLHRAGCTWDEWQTLQTLYRRDSGHRTGDAARYANDEFIGLASCAACGERLYVHRTYYRDRQTRAVKAVYEGLECPAARWSVDCPSAGGILRVVDLRAAWLAWLAVAFPATAFPLGWERAVHHQMQVAMRQRRRSGSDLSDARAGEGLARDPKQLARDLKRAQERRQAAIDARLDGWIDASEARARVADADAEIAQLQASLAGDAERAKAASASASAEAERMAEIVALLRVGQQGATWAALWPQMTREERTRAARLMLEPEGLRVRTPKLNQRGRHAPAITHTRKVDVPDGRVTSGLIVEVRLRPDFAHALALLRERADRQASGQIEA